MLRIRIRVLCTFIIESTFGQVIYNVTESYMKSLFKYKFCIDKTTNFACDQETNTFTSITATATESVPKTATTSVADQSQLATLTPLSSTAVQRQSRDHKVW